MFNLRKSCTLYLCVILVGMLSFLCGAADPIYSGPQLGEKVTTFKVADVSGVSAGRVREVLPGKDRAAVLVFISGVERSIVPLMTVVDQYGYERRDSLSAEFVFLSDDRVASTKRLPLVGQSLGMRCPMTISVDGPEGPGNYGLNKAVLMTILVAKEGRVTANFALVQPGIADAPAVIAAMAKASGDANPPTAEVLRERRLKATGGSSTRRAAASMPSRPAATGQKTELPGAAPTDAKLLAMLRSFIQPDNDDAKVDRIAREVEDYVKDNPELTRQAVGGWTRVLYLKYGTEYARNAGQKLVERLKK